MQCQSELLPRSINQYRHRETRFGEHNASPDLYFRDRPAILSEMGTAERMQALTAARLRVIASVYSSKDVEAPTPMMGEQSTDTKGMPSEEEQQYVPGIAWDQTSTHQTSHEPWPHLAG